MISGVQALLPVVGSQGVLRLGQCIKWGACTGDERGRKAGVSMTCRSSVVRGGEMRE